jgi:hypothetical protein
MKSRYIVLIIGVIVAGIIVAAEILNIMRNPATTILLLPAKSYSTTNYISIIPNQQHLIAAVCVQPLHLNYKLPADIQLQAQVIAHNGTVIAQYRVPEAYSVMPLNATSGYYTLMVKNESTRPVTIEAHITETPYDPNHVLEDPTSYCNIS